MAWPPKIATAKPHERPKTLVTKAEVDQALLGLLNRDVFTRHPKAHEVIRRLWAEVQSYRSKSRDGR